MGTGARVVSRSRQLLLAVLLAAGGAVVPSSRLVELLWPFARPTSVEKSLQVHVHRLRRWLGAAGVVRYQAPGYRLEVPREQVDLYRFEDLTQRGAVTLTAGDPAGAVGLLRAALTLYRGPAFQGFEDVAELGIEAHRLAGQLLTATEHRVDAEIALGRHTALVTELESLLEQHPLRERFRAQLMTALYRSGRKADALAVYRSGRRLMVEELGVEPGEECRDLERAILADDPSLIRDPDRPAQGAVPVPRQLPPDVEPFAGRKADLRWLDQLIGSAPRDNRSAPVVVAVDGTAGVGKTAFAVRWARRVADRFPDGQLFVDLRGHSVAPPLRPVEALTRLLPALGAGAEELTDDEAAIARYRSLIAGKRMLIVLDDAGSADQVRPLLPGAAGCLVLVTSRYQLRGLVARDGAQRLPLDVLTPAEAVELVGGLLGDGPVAAEPAAVADLVGLCGRLPLALRVAAAGLSVRPRPRISDWVRRMRAGDVLAALAVPGDRAASVAAALDLSYRRLSPPAQRLFRLIGLAPGPDLAVAAAAALAGDSADRVAAQLAELLNAHVVEESTSGRFTCHDLLRRYAAQRAHAQESEADRAAALARLYDHYLATTAAGVRVLFPGMLTLSTAPDGVPAADFAGPGGARAWFEAERVNLTAAIDRAAAHGPHQVAWRLADPLRIYLAHCGHPRAAIAVAEAGLTAATADGAPRGHAGALLGIANVYFQLGRYRSAAAYAARGWRLVRGTDWSAGKASARYLLGAAFMNLGRDGPAVRHFLAALSLAEQCDWQNGHAAVVSNLAVLLYNQGRLREAADYAGRAARAFEVSGATISRGGALTDLGNIHYVWGELDRARDYYTRARECYRAAGSAEESEPLLGLSMVHLDAGDAASARQDAESALRIARAADSRLELPCLIGLAVVDRVAGSSGPAVARLRQAIALARRTGDRGNEAYALVELAAVRPPHGGYEIARERAGRALAAFRELGYQVMAGQALSRLAEIELAAGAVETAARLGEQALSCHRQVGYRLEEARSCQLLGRVHERLDDQVAARTYFAQAGTLFQQVGVGSVATHRPIDM